MGRKFEVDGVLEGGRLIRLKEPLPWKEGSVKVTVTQGEESESREANHAALEALDRLLAEPDDMTPEQWAELDKIIAGQKG